MRTAPIAALLLALAGPAEAKAPPSLASAQAMVRALYAARTPDSSRETVRRLYAPALAAELLKAMDPLSPEGLPFDMRYGDQDWRVRRLAFSVKPAPGGCVVVARFRSFGVPHEVDWRMVRAGGRWRIADVTAPAEGEVPGWSLLASLKDSNGRAH